MSDLTDQNGSVHQTWTSRLAFITVAIGGTVGFGNLWKFPYVAGENGGGVFILVYLFTVFAIATPIFMAETLIGRAGRLSPPAAMRKLAREAGHPGLWALAGYGGIFTSILILSYAGVFSASALAYVIKAAAGSFEGAGRDGIAALWQGYMSDPVTVAAWSLFYAALNAFVVGSGIRRGIETVMRALLPVMFLLLIILVIYGIVAGAFGAALAHLFRFDPASFTAGTILAAIGQAFFTMSVGVGAIMVFGAYIGEKTNLGTATLMVAAGDTIVALLAGLAIFPIVFAHGLDPAEGPPLLFLTVPVAFGEMPLGTLAGTLFFILFFFAAITSTIGLSELAVSWLEERRRGKRMQNAILVWTVVWIIGLATIFSNNIWSGVHPLAFLPHFAGATIFEIIDEFTSNIWLPLGGILFSIFAGWVLPARIREEELGLASHRIYTAWLFAVRYLAPLAVVAIFISNL